MSCDEAFARVRIPAALLLWLPVLLLAGCSGAQSTLSPAGLEAERIATLFWWMTAGSVAVWSVVVILAVYAVRARPEVHRRQANALILTGAVLPAVVLGVLLVPGLGMLPDMIAPAPQGTLRISVYGEQWWWRVRYEPPGGQPFETANEVRLPVGEPVEFLLHSNNVIHSFWIPALGGKMDMIPGRVNRLALHPTKTGSFRGACAEFCGRGHANMRFHAIVLPADEFRIWLARQAEPAAQTATTGDAQP
jgi:cytochrome c oxidase subunit 2